MAEFPAMPLWTDAYLADTGHLTTLEHGAYLLLLMTMWRNGGTLPNDDVKLARYARVTRGQWGRIKPTILDFFEVDDEQISQSRLTAEMGFVRQKRESAKNSANAKWLKTKKTGYANASSSQSERPATTPTPIKDRNLDCFRDIRGDVRVSATSDDAAAWLSWFRAQGRQPPNPYNGVFYFKTKTPPPITEAS